MLESRELPSTAAEGPPRHAVVAIRLNGEAKAEREAAKRKEKLQALKLRSGFLRVWKLLTAAKKPMVGHNCLYDLMFMYDHFEGPLPPTVTGAWPYVAHTHGC